MRDPAEGIFEIRRKDRDSLILLNLVEDLEYPARVPIWARPLPKHGFVYLRSSPSTGF